MKIQKKLGGGGGGGGRGRVGGGGVRVDVIEELKFWGKFKKSNFLGGRLDRVGVGGQGGCEQRIEVFVKIPKKNIFFFGGGGRGGGSGWGVRVDVNEELEVFGKIHKKKIRGGWGGGSGGGVRLVGGSGWM